MPDCHAVPAACGSHGRCVAVQGVAACECDPGHAPPDCSACAPGFQDRDGDGACAPACGPDYPCENGTCVDDVGAARCACAQGFLPRGNTCVREDGRTCGTPLPLALVDQAVTGTTRDAGNDASGTCQSYTSDEVVYRLEVTEPTRARFRALGFDTVVYVRTSCEDPGTELACSDEVAGGFEAAVELELEVGTYYLFVDGYGDNRGSFTLEVEADCGRGLVRDPVGAGCVDDPCVPNPCAPTSTTQCTPVLPGSFTCGCASGHVLADGACVPDPDALGRTCQDPLVLAAGGGTMPGSTASGALRQHVGSCGGEGPERLYTFTLADRRRFHATSAGYDTTLHLRSSCGDATSELACNDDSRGMGSALDVVLQAGTYFLLVDSFRAGGSYTLTWAFQTDPCAGDPCPGTPACVTSPDWSAHACRCAAGTMPWREDCVDDPCQPNPCVEPHRTRCAALLPGAYACGCSPGHVEGGGDACVADPAAADWTVMVYLDADNDLEPHGFDDVDEMGLVGSSAAVNVVVLLDGLTRDGGRARDLRVTPGGFEVLEELGEVDMSDWRTLRDFGVRTMHRYPARRHALILWDHGAGWKSAGRAVPHKEFAHDESAGGAAMSVSRGDYASALAGIKEALGEKLDVIAFDACLMGTWEVAHASAPYGAYLVASQETMPVTGYDYDGFLRLLVDAPSMDGRELARVLADTTAEDSVDNVTQSVVRLESLWVVDQAVSDLADALLAHPDAHGLVEQARRMAQHFSGDDLRDLRGLADALGVLAGVPADVGTAARTLSAAVGVVVEHNRTQGGYQGAHGLSAYMPARGSGLDQDYTGPGATWSQVTTWDDWLMRFTR